MTPARLRECLALAHWSAQGFGRVLGVDERQVRRWVSGDNAIPPPVASWLEALARWHEAHPVPAARVKPPRGAPAS